MDAKPLALWVDTDIALGADRGDVDDGFALAAVLAAVRRWPRRFELLGISTVSGNAPAAEARNCAIRLAAEFGQVASVSGSIPADALAAGTHLLCLGPLSNLATLLRDAPAIADRLRLSMVGGVSEPLRHPLLRLMDLNARRDPGAWRLGLSAVFQRRWQFPLDVIRALDLGANDLDRLAAVSGPGAYLAEQSRRWLRQIRWRHPSGRFPAWDLVATLAALDLLPDARWQGERLVNFNAVEARSVFLELLSG